MKSESTSHRSSADKPIASEASREWEELADAVEPLVETELAQVEVLLESKDERVAEAAEQKEKARLEKERNESRALEDLVKSGVERAADDQGESNAMRYHP